MYHLLWVSLLLLLPAVARAQDSGPGPVTSDATPTSSTVQEYDVTLYQWFSMLSGALDFTTTGTTGVTTTGSLKATINSEAFTGAWHAYDLGGYAFWAAQGTGTTHTLIASGWSTPQEVIGVATLGGSSSSGKSIFRWLSWKTYFFFGQVPVVAPTATTTKN